MSKRLLVLTAVVDCLRRTFPAAAVVGLEGAETATVRPPVGGRIVVRTGDRGEPEVDLSPTTYWWEHRIPLEIALPGNEADLDAMLEAIEHGIQGDPTLASLCSSLDFGDPVTGQLDAKEAGARGPRGALVDLVASYSTSSALS